MGHPLCRHCDAKKPNRPRGLCWTCYYTPGVKDLYPSTSKYARRGTGGGFGGLTLPDYPTDAVPGSEEKIQIMMERAAGKVSLHHPDDHKIDPVEYPPWSFQVYRAKPWYIPPPQLRDDMNGKGEIRD